MRPLEVTSIQRGCVYDGHGVRTTIFLKGCPFSCPWCCNPETLYGSRDYFLDDKKCLYLGNTPSTLCDGCERKNGHRPIAQCPIGVYTPTTQIFDDIHELATLVSRDKNLFISSGGGVTLSGGEPLLQATALVPFLKTMLQEGIKCAMETTLYIKNVDTIKTLLPFIDEWIIDLKLQRVNYREDYLETMNGNLSLLREYGKDTRFRLVYVESLDAEDTYRRLYFLGVKALEVIKCHGLSKSKYEKLGLPFIDYTPSDSSYDDFLARLANHGISSIKLKL